MNPSILLEKNRFSVKSCDLCERDFYLNWIFEDTYEFTYEFIFFFSHLRHDGHFFIPFRQDVSDASMKSLIEQSRSFKKENSEETKQE